MYVFQEGSLPGNARKKMSLILYSDHTPPPQLTVSVPAPGKAFSAQENLELQRDGDVALFH